MFLHLRLSWCTSRWHKQCLTPRKHKYWSTSRLRFRPLPDLLRLQQGAQFSPCRAHRLHLHLWWSTSRRHQQFMLHLRLSWCTSRQYNQCLTPCQHWYCVLCASACCLCRTYCDCNRWLCFSPCRAHRLHTNFGGVHRAGISSTCCTCTCRVKHRAASSIYATPAPVVEHIAPELAVYAVPAPVVKHIVLAQAVSYATPAEVLKHFEFAPAAYAAPTATATGRFGSLSVVPTVSTLTCGKVHRASTGSVGCTCACRGIHRACTSSVLGRVSTGTGLLGASACSLRRNSCDCNRWLRFSPCRAYFFSCTCGAIHRANTRSYAAPAPVMSTSRQHNSFLRRASSNTEYLSLSWSIPFILVTRCR